ncbi:MAG: hypothetical protein QOI92_788 [Chloroflexota bacterium]|jgi:uncharacterized membrane protein|nr:hypothetical protein [Chloroflexota bacterium]
MSWINLDPGETRGGLESALARVLAIGTYASMALVAIGLVLLVAGGGSPLDPGPPLSLATLGGDLLAGGPAGFLWLGILGVIGTPALRVTGALVGFWRAGERRMALIALLILVVVGIGVVAGLVTG